MDSKNHIDEKITLRPGLPRDTYSCLKIAVEALFDFN